MKWEITDFDIVSPTSPATETDALALTQNLGSNPQAMQDMLMGHLNRVLESIDVPPPPEEGNKNLSIPFELQDKSGLRIKGILKETYTYGQIEKLKTDETERLVLTKSIQNFLELLIEKSTSTLSNIDQIKGKLSEIANQIGKISNNKAIIEQYKTKIEQIKHKFTTIKAEYVRLIGSLHDLTPKIEQEIITSVDTLLEGLSGSDPEAARALKDVVQREARGVINNQFDEMALLREESAEKASPEKITSAIGDRVEQALVTTGNTSAKQLWGKIKQSVEIKGDVGPKLVSIVENVQALQQKAISLQDEAGVVMRETKEVMGTTTEAMAELTDMFAELNQSPSLGGSSLSNS